MSDAKTPKVEDKDGLPYGYAKFKKAIIGQPPDTAKLLSCHLLAEYYLEQIILISIKRGDILLTDGGLLFSSKLLVVRSLDVISDSTLTSLKHLNKVRNSCSHSMDYKVTDSDIDLIGRPLGKSYTVDIKKNHEDNLLEATLSYLLGKLTGSYKVILDKAKEL